jgi:hypothetical protein
MLGLCKGKGVCHQGCTFSLAQLTTIMCGLIMFILSKEHMWKIPCCCGCCANAPCTQNIAVLCVRLSPLCLLLTGFPTQRSLYPTLPITMVSWMEVDSEIMTDSFEPPVSEASNRST